MAVNGKSFVVLDQSPLALYRVLAEDKAVYVLYDVTADAIRGIYADAHLRCPVCGLWHWAEREIGNVVRAAVEKEKTGSTPTGDGGRIVSVKSGACPA